MQKDPETWFNRLKCEVCGSPLFYLTLTLTLTLALFIRIYRVDQILGFYYDQGRDALVVWDLLHKGKFFLIGPTTGIAGIFRGPFYYYLIAPFYALGGGNPVWPSVFLAVTSLIAIVLIYFLGVKIQGRVTGLIAVILASFSYYIFYASRWLSNPTPMLLVSMILVWAMYKISEGDRSKWWVVALVSGLSLFSFGSAGEVFYIPAIAVFAIWQTRLDSTSPARRGKNLPDKKMLAVSVILFILTFAPLVMFDLKHEGILRQNIAKFFVTDKSFAFPTWRWASDKLAFFYDVFGSKIFHTRFWKENVLLGTLGILFVYKLHEMLKNDKVKILFILLVSPIVGLIFFQGNFGNIYDYYLTGYYLIFLLLIAVMLGYIWKTNLLGKLFVVYIMFAFWQNNWPVIQSTISDKGTDATSVAFSNQKRAIEWVYTDAKNVGFNVDVYVPPVIPYAYNYLFQWYGQEKFGRLPSEERLPLLYTISEPDGPNPDRLDAWLARQKGIGKVEETVKFGGITVQRRFRY